MFYNVGRGIDDILVVRKGSWIPPNSKTYILRVIELIASSLAFVAHQSFSVSPPFLASSTVDSQPAANNTTPLHNFYPFHLHQRHLTSPLLVGF